jgi:hypothetical protein
MVSGVFINQVMLCKTIRSVLPNVYAIVIKDLPEWDCCRFNKFRMAALGNNPLILRKQIKADSVMKKFLLLLGIAAVLMIAYATKPDDKTCIIAAVKAVWGNKVPDVNNTPSYYEQFMNLTSKQVIIDDWIFLKRIRYRFPSKEYNIGFALFNQIIMND